jgi:hypothetical protein
MLRPGFWDGWLLWRENFAGSETKSGISRHATEQSRIRIRFIPGAVTADPKLVMKLEITGFVLFTGNQV